MTVLEKRIKIRLDKVLLATDFSSAAEKAGAYAKAIAQRYSSAVRLVHVVDLSAAVQMPDAGVSIDLLRRDGADRLERERAQLASAKIKVETTLGEGLDPATIILQIAKRESVDLIVSGTRGHGALARLALGSTAERLIHHAECPLLTIGQEAIPSDTPGQFQRIVYATDLSPEAAKAASFALSFAQDCHAHIYLCHVVPKAKHGRGEDSRELTEKFVAALRTMDPDIAQGLCEPECTVEHAYAADGVLLLAHRVRADLIVVGTRRASHWFDSLKAGIAYEVARAATCPVLTVRG